MIGAWKRTRSSVVAWGLVASLGCNGASSAGSNTAPAQADASREQSQGQTQPRPHGTPQPTLAMGTVEIERPAPQAPLTVRVEVAADDRQRQMGLMFRERLGELEGMLFIFPNQQHHSFWMRNTLLPLDMFFIDANWNVVGVVENAAPLTETPREVDGDSQYVLEVNAGFAKRHGLGAGTKMRFAAKGEKP